ncbi:MAG: GHKL domain-containing protein [Clostridia bacterium]|nr:GHKL domain-containing protein [Clostridia bacterium]
MLVFRYIFGFFIQLFPYAFFCCYPFYDHFRIDRKKSILSVCAVCIFMCVIFVWFGLFPLDMFEESRSDLICNLIFYITLLILFICYIFLIQAELFQKVFVFFIVMSYGFLVMEFINFLIQIFETKRDPYLYSPAGLLFHLLINALLFYPVLKLMQRIRSAALSPLGQKTWMLLSLVPASFLLVVSLCLQLPNVSGMGSTDILHILAVSVLFYMFFVYLWIFRVLDQEQIRSEEAATMKVSLDNYRRTAENVNEIRKLRHEMSHHTQALSLYFKEQDYDGARVYLEKITEEISHMPALDYTPHTLMNSILTEYKLRAEKLSVHTEYQIVVPAHISIDDIDLCRLLTNLLDNALEACEALEPEKRFIQLSIRLNGKFLFFSCENAYDKNRIRYENGVFLSTKPYSTELKGLHGFGIPVMKEITEKYNGAFQTIPSSDRFCTAINLCLSSHKQ